MALKTLLLFAKKIALCERATEHLTSALLNLMPYANDPQNLLIKSLKKLLLPPTNKYQSYLDSNHTQSSVEELI